VPRVPLLTAALLALVAAPASASVARVEVSSRYGATSNTVVYAAAPGEANALTISSGAPGTITLHDAAATVTAAIGCVSIDAQTARCGADPLAQLLGVRATTGDLADSVTTTIADPLALGPAASVVVDAGPGDDHVRGDGTLRGGAGADTLQGGPGPDVLAGGAGADILQAGAGADTLFGDDDTGSSAAADAGDLLDGGPGADTASYATRTIPVAVDLAAPGRAGAAGERDVLRGIENVAGGTAADTLRGDGGPNRLDGGTGTDTLDGRGGNDTLGGGDAGVDLMTGGAGDDVLQGGHRSDGGPGDDTLTGTNRRALLDGGPGADLIDLSALPAALACGAGPDVVSTFAGLLAGVRLDGCERVVFGAQKAFGIAVAPARRATGSLALPVTCGGRNPIGSAPCTVVVSIRLIRPGRPAVSLGRTGLTLASQTSATAVIAPGRAARRALRAGAGRPLVEVTVRGTGLNAFGLGGRWRVRLSRR
jgi:Ca2+-binding RTX toxin-like protein